MQGLLLLRTHFLPCAADRPCEKNACSIHDKCEIAHVKLVSTSNKHHNFWLPVQGGRNMIFGYISVLPPEKRSTTQIKQVHSQTIWNLEYFFSSTFCVTVVEGKTPGWLFCSWVSQWSLGTGVGQKWAKTFVAACSRIGHLAQFGTVGAAIPLLLFYAATRILMTN